MEEPITNQAYFTEIPHLEDLKNHIGKELGLSEWMKVTQEKIDSFAKTTDDNQWIHINPALAKKHSPYKRTIAHGFFVLSLCSKFCYETVKLLDVGMGVNYGLDKVRFMNATPSDSLIRARVSLLSYDSIPGGAKYKLKLVFELKGQEKPACVAEFIAQAYADPNKKNNSNVALVNTPTDTNAINSDVVNYTQEGAVVTVSFNRPERYNAVNDDLVKGLKAAIAKVRKDDSVHVMILTGEGKGFCAGADMENFGSSTAEEGRAYISGTYIPLMRDLFTLKKPVIAAINGTAAGVGASLALACDFRVMNKKSALLCAFINIGLGPDGGASWLLARQIGYSRALQMAIEGEKVFGEECYRLGLCNHLVDEDVLTKAKSWAEKLAQRPGLAVGITKQDMFYAMDHSLYETIAYEAEKQVEAFDSHDLVEGVAAFVAKRKPKFIGK